MSIYPVQWGMRPTVRRRSLASTCRRRTAGIATGGGTAAAEVTAGVESDVEIGVDVLHIDYCLEGARQPAERYAPGASR